VNTEKTILFIEDEAELRTTVSGVLKDNGYRVVSVGSAEVALETLKKETPDLLLVDVKLPGIDGFDFFQTVRTVDEWKDIPVVFLTAFNNLQAAVYAKQHGAAEYITKPFDFEFLITRIVELLPLN
jgi:DNA-binding response OmpR family regulator